MLYLSNFFFCSLHFIHCWLLETRQLLYLLLTFLLLCSAGEILYTFTIITTDSSSTLKWLHGNLFPGALLTWDCDIPTVIQLSLDLRFMVRTGPLPTYPTPNWSPNWLFTIIFWIFHLFNLIFFSLLKRATSYFLLL